MDLDTQNCFGGPVVWWEDNAPLFGEKKIPHTSSVSWEGYLRKRYGRKGFDFLQVFYCVLQVSATSLYILVVVL